MRRVALISLVMVLFLAAAPAMAQQGDFTAAVLLGTTNIYNAHLDGDFGAGLQLGWNFDQHWALQGELMLTDPNPDTPQGVDGMLPPGSDRPADVMLGSMNLAYFWKHENRALTPFFSAGVSWLDIQYNDYYNQAADLDGIGWGLNIAGGLRYDMAGRSFFLGQVRWNSVFNPQADALQLIVGFGIGLGGH